MSILLLLFLTALPLKGASIPAEFIIPSREIESPSRLRDVLDGLKARFQNTTSQKQRPKRPYNESRRKWLLGGTVGLATAGAIIAYRTLIRGTNGPQDEAWDNGTSDNEGAGPMEPLDWVIQDARQKGWMNTVKGSFRILTGTLKRAFSGSQKQPTRPHRPTVLDPGLYSPSSNPYDDAY
jgi:hypothetical protein